MSHDSSKHMLCRVNAHSRGASGSRCYCLNNRVDIICTRPSQHIVQASPWLVLLEKYRAQREIARTIFDESIRHTQFLSPSFAQG